ncbi:DUF1801 domain-containing protein [Actinocrispum sp. NPDC049592]|uniref:DUF1801 domain-containing protein n=1 Tax=Actinocrispum sp. NPDC049592 TaxID=3154835 RepID=UPI0034370425
MDPAVQRILDLGGPLTILIHELLLDVYPTAVLTADSENIGYGASTGYRGLRFTVAPFDDYVRLGIAGGASLEDPTGLLQGTGKVHRHIKIRSGDELANPALHALLKAALN